MATTRKAAASRRKAPPASDGKSKDRDRGTSPWEWAVAALGCLILVGFVAYLVWEAFARPTDGPPVIDVVTAETMTVGDRYLVKVLVVNRGDATGANVEVSGTLLDGDRTLEESTVTFDFIPPRSEKNGGLYFDHDPGQFRLVPRVKGYAEP